LDTRIANVLPQANQKPGNTTPSLATSQIIRQEVAPLRDKVELPRASEGSSPREPSSIIVLNPPAPAAKLPTRTTGRATEHEQPRIARSTEPSRVDLKFKISNRTVKTESDAISSNVSSSEVREADSPRAGELDKLYEVSDRDSKLTILQQPGDQVSDSGIQAPLIELDDAYSDGASLRANISQFITPLQDHSAQPTPDSLPKVVHSAAPLRNPEEARVASLPTVQPIESRERVDALLEPETMYFEADHILGRSSSDSQPVMTNSATTEHAGNAPEVDDLTIALLPERARDEWLSESPSDSSPAPLHSLYDPASRFSGGPAALTASTFANQSSTPKPEMKSPSTLTTPRPDMGSLIGTPSGETFVPNVEAQAPAKLAYPQWVGQADTDVHTRQNERGPSRQLVHPTIYRAETDSPK
jgi:hypothetical protein